MALLSLHQQPGRPSWMAVAVATAHGSHGAVWHGDQEAGSRIMLPRGPEGSPLVLRLVSDWWLRTDPMAALPTLAIGRQSRSRTAWDAMAAMVPVGARPEGL